MSSAAQPGNPEPSPLLAQVRGAYGRVAYTHKTHEKQADICFQSHRRQQRLLVGLTILSSGTFLASLLGVVLDESGAALGTSFIALLVSGINLGTKTFKYGEDMQGHRDVAARLWNLRESYQSLIVDIQSGAISDDDGRGRRDQLQNEAAEIFADAPRTTAAAYAMAQKALQEKEDLTFSTREIDLLLPEVLRLGQEPGDGGQ